MSNPRRIVPGTTYLVTRRTTRRHFLMNPDKRRVLLAVYWYATALLAAEFGIEIHAVQVLSNHMHEVLTDTRGELPKFLSQRNRLMANAIKVLRESGFASPQARRRFERETEIVATLDEPFADPSSFPTWYLARATERHVKVVLGGDGIDRQFTIFVDNVNEAPTGLVLSPSSIAENNAVGAVVGAFSSLDPDAGDTFNYTLVSGTGSTDNAKFTIVGNQLKALYTASRHMKNAAQMATVSRARPDSNSAPNPALCSAFCSAASTNRVDSGVGRAIRDNTKGLPDQQHRDLHGAAGP